MTQFRVCFTRVQFANSSPVQFTRERDANEDFHDPHGAQEVVADRSARVRRPHTLFSDDLHRRLRPTTIDFLPARERRRASGIYVLAATWR